ncbi:hypothetical protein AB6M97_08955 [Streptococcus hillyeri]|uniref:hypothetical protein n=1 Tax=Streptococcus hillyeri TaxID=2282420 RepID=UPI0034E1D8FF
MSFKISASLVGLEEFNLAIDEVKQKAEELEQAIQRLNGIELDIEFGDIKKEPTQIVDSENIKTGTIDTCSIQLSS